MVALFARPTTWTLFVIGMALALLAAAILTLVIPRLPFRAWRGWALTQVSHDFAVVLTAGSHSLARGCSPRRWAS
jgi:hypothetical protein